MIFCLETGTVTLTFGDRPLARAVPNAEIEESRSNVDQLKGLKP